MPGTEEEKRTWWSFKSYLCYGVHKIQGISFSLWEKPTWLHITRAVCPSSAWEPTMVPTHSLGSPEQRQALLAALQLNLDFRQILFSACVDLFSGFPGSVS